MATASSAYPDLDRSPKKNWVEKVGGLPKLIERVAKHLHYEKGRTISVAIATAINWAKKMCATGTAFGGKTKVGAKAQAAACKTVGEWEKKKAASKMKEAIEEALLDAGHVMTVAEERELVEAFAARLQLAEGLLLTLNESATTSSVENARALLEGGRVTLAMGGEIAPASALRETRAQLEAETALLRVLVEGLDPMALEERAAAAEPLTVGAKGDRVVHLQNRLTSLGHKLVGDGDLGEKTAEALRTFKRDHGLDETDEVDVATTQALRDPETAKAQAAAAVQHQPGVLYKGIGVGEETGDKSVREVQRQLGVEPDGSFGPETEKAVKRLQRRYGMRADGLVGGKTKRVLASVAKKTEAKANAKKTEAKPAAKGAEGEAKKEAGSSEVEEARTRLQECADALQVAARADDGAAFMRLRARRGVLEKRLQEAETRAEKATRRDEGKGTPVDETDMKTCPSCGWKNRKGRSACEKCNKPLVAEKGPRDAEEAKLSSGERKSLPKSAFAVPPDRYPIHDESHARNALARASGKPEEGQVRAAVFRRYPNLKPDKKKVQEADTDGIVELKRLPDGHFTPKQEELRGKLRPGQRVMVPRRSRLVEGTVTRADRVVTGDGTMIALAPAE